MATGGSDLCDSDKVFDHLCSVCKKKNISTEASVYCEDCADYYCDKCVDVHKTVPALSEHVLLTASHGKKLPSLPTSKCDKHTKNVIDMYCQDDDDVGCIKCITINHRKCREMHEITNFVKDNTNIVPAFIREVESTETELKSRMNVFHQELTELQQNKKHVIKYIQATRDKLIDIIRKQTEDAIQKVEETYDTVHNDLKANVTDLKHEIDKIDKLLKDISSVSYNVPEVFVLSKKSKDVVSKATKLNKDMKRVTLGKRLAFDLDSLYKTVLDFKISGQGNVVITPRLYSFSKIKDVGLVRHSFYALFAFCRTFYNLCCTPDGSVFFTDYGKESSIHRICYKTLNVVEKRPMPYSRYGVCCVSNSTIAVGLGTTIQMIDITGKLKLTDSIKFDHDIRGLDCHDDIFYATSSDCVYKYDRNGKLLKSYSKYPDGNNIFSDIRNLVVNPLNKHIHVADYKNGVITMSQEGHVLNVVTDNISRPWGICVDQYGQVFVSGSGSNNIIQLSCDGRYITTVISERLYGPRGICFDTARGRLYIGDISGCVKFYIVENVTE